MIFSQDQARRYFEFRLPEERIPSRDAISVRCPFHADRTASLSIKLSEAVWMCHAGCGKGGILDFEKSMFPGGNSDSWWASITKICGLEPNRRGQRELGELVATYNYTDPTGKILFQKLRYEPKNFLQRAITPNGGFVYSLNGVQKPLYRLVELVQAQVAMVTEGEKDADALAGLNWQSMANGKPMPTVAATCNFDGAGPRKWKDEYGPYFAGKMTVVFPDNDAIGKVHAAEVAQSVSRYAHTVKVVELPGLEEHGDVSDYLKIHTVADLMDVIKKTPYWEPEKDAPSKPFFVPPSEIMKGETSVDWIVPGVIHKGGKGVIIAAPKAGKSMIALDLAVALASRQSWLGLPARKEPLKTAMISREDGPGMTKRRIRQFAQGRDVDFRLLDEWLRFNTYEQKGSFSIQSDADIEEIVKWIKQEGIEFCIFDVLNLLHSADENSNTQMTQVMRRFDSIREQTGADIAVIHHDKKDAAPGSKKPRGASAIDSWWEWKVSVSPDPENEMIKQVFFGSKATMPHNTITVEFKNDGEAIYIAPAIGH